MKNRIIALILSIVMVVSMLPVQVLAAGATYSEGLEYTLSSDGTYYIVSGIGTCQDTDLIIPATHEGLPVKEIGIGAFYECDTLTSVTIPDSVTNIVTQAFYGCDALTSVTIPKSVTAIGKLAFCCDNITNIVVDAENTAYSSDQYGVLFNKDMTEVVCCPNGKTGEYTIPDTVTHIADYAFYECDTLTSVTIPDSVAIIGNYAFHSCKGLNAVTFGNSLTTIGSAAFMYCTSLTDVVIPESVTTIGEAVFSKCASLENVTIPNSVTSIGIHSFSGCASLTSIDFWTRVFSTIPQGTFQSCTGLTNITFPSNITEIGDYAFRDCTGLVEIRFEGDAPAFAADVFDTLSSTTVTATAYYPADNATWTEDVRQNYGGAITWEAYGEEPAYSEGLTYTLSSDGTYYIVSGIGTCQDTDIVIPATHEGLPVKEIGESAFYQCAALTSVTIPDSVTSIGEYAFLECTSLIEIVVDAENTAYSNDQYGVLFNKDKTELICCPAAKTGAYTIPDSVATIGNNAFRYCFRLTNVTIPDSVITIGDYAFADCTALTNVTIGESVTTIGDYAFYHCFRLTNVTIPDSVIIIGDRAFYACDTLAGVTIPASVTIIGDRAFSNCASLTEIVVDAENTAYSSDQYGVLFNKDKTELICCPAAKTGAYTIPDSVTTIGSYAFECCTALTDVVIPESVTTIGSLAFDRCNALTDVVIPESVTTIGSAAFMYCTSLTDVVIPESVTTIGETVFGSCTSLENVTIPDSVTAIGAYAFRGCTALTDVVIPESVTTIGSYAFRDCTALTSATIPNSVTAIGIEAFAFCTALGEITFKGDAPSIGRYAFWYCTALTEITFKGDAPSFGNNVFYKVTATAYYPADNATWTEDVRQNYGGTITWVAYDAEPAYSEGLEYTLSSDGTYYIVSGIGTCQDTDIVIPATHEGLPVKEIGGSAFENNDTLTSVTIPDSVTTIGSYAFDHCTALTDVVIPESVTTIGAFVFQSCESLTSITIPDSVTSIGEYAFLECTSLIEIVVDAENTAYSNDQYGVLFNKDKTELICCPAAKTGAYTIPDSVATIGNAAFMYCAGLTDVVIPESVTTIGSNAFHYCTALTSATIPNSVTTIGWQAFCWCYRLTSVTIPDSVITIGGNAFYNCTALTNVTIGESVTTVGTGLFGSCESLTDIDFWTSVFSTIPKLTFQYCTGLTSITIPENITEICDYAFSHCTALTEVTFKGDAPSFGNAVFNGMSATAYYPANNETWTEDVRQNYGGTITWVPYGEEACQHTETAVTGAVPATCTAPGYTGDTVCASCGELLTQGEEIPQLEHDYTETVTAPTCAAAGYTLHTCSLCGDSYISDYTEALGHNYQNTASLAPTCTAAGYDIYGCQNDGCDSEKKYIIPATGHQFGDDNVCDVCGFTVPEDHTHTYTSVVVLPTCTTAGYTEHTCDCGHSYQTDLMEPTGHHWDEGTVTVAPTCTEDGLLVYACVNCDAVITELLPAAHRWSTTVTKEPTCTEDGSATRVCESCGLEETVVLPAGHSWDEGVITKAPTCTEDGTKTVTCTVCGAAEVQPVEKLGHHFVNGVCTRCGSGIFDIVTPSNHHLQYGMYFDVDDVVSNYGPDLINEYGVYLDYNKDADIRRVGIYLTQEGNLWRRCIACVGEGITSATYVPYLSYGSDIKYTGLNNDGINVFPLSKNADGIWCYNDYATIGVNLEDRYGNLLLSLYDIGQSGARTRIFTDLDEMIRWLQEDIEAMCNDVGYPTVEEALAAAKSGDVVTLVDDAEVDVLLIPAGVTLDLDIYDLHAKGVLGITGSKLTAAEYSVGSDWGKLYVQGPEYLVLSGCVENNNGKEVGLLPVWDGDQGCYVMGGALYNTDNYTLTTDETTISFMFAPSLRGDLRKAFFTDENEMSDNGLSIVLRLTWHSGDGLAQQDFVYSSEFVSKFCKSGSGLFTFTLTGYEAMYIELEDLTITPMIVCDNGLTFRGQTVTGA